MLVGLIVFVGVVVDEVDGIGVWCIEGVCWIGYIVIVVIFKILVLIGWGVGV